MGSQVMTQLLDTSLLSVWSLNKQQHRDGTDSWVDKAGKRSRGMELQKSFIQHPILQWYWKHINDDDNINVHEMIVNFKRKIEKEMVGDCFDLEFTEIMHSCGEVLIC